ncbi:glycosyltransferase family 32 protein [Cystobasidium minutum MCA 4210]|uniref:glycosyltransferase family 32 protein n=1 Tax=Cystobasidium minutum MCA 4210 TaxID=1397322 RepID=UPI0034CF0851|eukprot:jgi/Rhomi1/153647/estExt_Genewise1.C_5_t10111
METRFSRSRPRAKDTEGIAGVFRRMSDIPVMQSDLLRYALLATEGGVYSDLDTVCLKAIDAWHETEVTRHHNDTSEQTEKGKSFARPAIIVGIEVDAASGTHGTALWQGKWPTPLSVVQWTFAGARGHPIFIDVMRRVVGNVNTQWPMSGPVRAKLAEIDVVRVTGPVTLTDSVLRYLRAKYNTTWPDLRDVPEEGVLFGDEATPADVLVLSVTAFSPGVGNFGSKSISSESALVQHLFAGSWRKGMSYDRRAV